jgi:hypothetical protein
MGIGDSAQGKFDIVIFTSDGAAQLANSLSNCGSKDQLLPQGQQLMEREK